MRKKAGENVVTWNPASCLPAQGDLVLGGAPEALCQQDGFHVPLEREAPWALEKAPRQARGTELCLSPSSENSTLEVLRWELREEVAKDLRSRAAGACLCTEHVTSDGPTGVC